MKNRSIFTGFMTIVKRDLLLVIRNRAEVVNPLIFFVLIVSLFPLAVSTEAKILKVIAAGVIWVAALISMVLSLDGLFRSDYEDGTLEQIAISPYPTMVLIMAKILTHWLVTGLPLLLLAPLLAYAMHLPSGAYGVLVLTVLLGTPTLSLLGSIGIALTVGLRQGGILLVLVVVPLYIPVLVLSASAIRLAINAEPVAGPLYALAALLMLALTLAPLATTAAIRLGLR